jgi:hypothetical protein
MRKLNDEQFNISDDLLMSFYKNGNFEPPTHRYNGKKPCIAILFDDCLGSGIFTKGIRKVKCLNYLS